MSFEPNHRWQLIAGADDRPDTVDATVNYLSPMSEKPVNYAFPPPPGIPQRSGRFERQLVSIRDARRLARRPSLDREGFLLIRYPTSVENLQDESAVRSIYYREIERLLKETTGATQVLI